MKFTSKPKLIEAVRFLGAVFDPETGKTTLHWAEPLPDWLEEEMSQPFSFIYQEKGALSIQSKPVGAGDWIVQSRVGSTPTNAGSLEISSMTNADLMHRYEPRLETEAEEEKD